MKKIYFLLFTLMMTIASFGQTTLFSESFEIGNSGTASEDCTDGSADFFTRTDGSNIGSFYEVTGQDGSFFFAGMDLDGAPCTMSTQTLIFNDIDITGATDLSFAILLAEDDSSDGAEDWDSSDQFLVEYDIDNSGAFTTLMDVNSNGVSTNGVPVLDGVPLTNVFTEFVKSIAATGSEIDIRLTFSLNSGDEDIAIDNLRLIDGFVANPSITITSPSAGTEFAPGTMSVDLEWVTANTAGGEVVNVTVNGNTTTNATSPFTIMTTDGTVYNATVELTNPGGTLDDSMTTFSVQQVEQVASIAALRMQTVGNFYTLNGEAILTYQQSSRNQKFIEDAPGSTTSAGIVIDDSAGTVTTAYNLGDGISGITGQLTQFGGTLQFVPSSDPGAATSTGNTLTPQVVTITELNSGAESYESELVQVLAVTMDNMTNSTFTTSSEIVITDQGSNTFTFRTSFFDADYVDANVPSMATDITGIISERFGPYYITARDSNDFSVQVLSNNDFETTEFSIFPNPTNTGEVTISSVNAAPIAVTVFDMLGKQVKNETISNNRLNVSNLKAGIYLLNITQDGAISTKKLVIR